MDFNFNIFNPRLVVLSNYNSLPRLGVILNYTLSVFSIFNWNWTDLPVFHFY
jgi:hypothetical protein